MKKLYTFLIAFLISAFAFSKDEDFTLLEIGAVPGTICLNETLYIPYTAAGFVGPNTFSVQISDATGLFTSPTVIGSVDATASGFIQVTIPASFAYGAGYVMRITSTEGTGISNNISSAININCTSNDYYWVGGSGNWTDTNHWANTTGGSGNAYASEPTTNDNVYFDSNSFPSGGQITLDTYANCNDMIWTDGSTNPVLWGDYGSALSVRGDFILANGVYRDIAYLFLSSNKSNRQLDLADNLYQSDPNTTYWITRIECYSGGSISLQSDVYADYLYLSGVTFNTNDHQLDLPINYLYSSGIFNAGTSIINTAGLYGYGTFNATASTITLSKNEYGNNPYWNGNQTYNSITIASGLCNVSGSNTIANLTIMPEAGLNLSSGTTQTITSSLTAVGTRDHLVTIKSQSTGNQATLFASPGASITANYVNIKDNFIDNGAAGTFNATNAVNGGNNTGWTFGLLSSLNYYWVGGAGNWNDTGHWATSDGGSSFHSSPPGLVDNVFFTSSSFSSSGATVTLTENAHCHNIIWQSGSGDNSPVLFSEYPNELVVHGSMQLDDGVMRNLYRINFNSEDIGNTIDLADNQFSGGDIDFNGNGEWTLLSNLGINWLNIRGGTFNSNGKTVNIINQLYIDYNNSGVINWGSSVVNLQNINIGSYSITFNTSSSTFNFNSPDYYTDSYLYPPVIFNNVTMNGYMNVYGSLETNNLLINPGTNISFADSYTNTIHNNFVAVGERGQFITLHSTYEGSQTTLYVLGANVNVEFADIQDVVIDNGTGFSVPELAKQSIDKGNNVGWDFLSVPIAGIDFYWVGGSGYWSDGGHWAGSSGGSDIYDYAPLSVDNVFFDASSFPSGGTLNLDYPVTVHSMDWTGSTSTVSISDGGDDDISLTVTGSFKLTDGVSRNFYQLIFDSNEPGLTIDMADNLYTNNSVYFYGTGNWSLLNDFDAYQTRIYGGTFTSNNFDFYSTILRLYNDNISFWGSSDVYVSRFTSYSLYDPLTFNAQSSTFTFDDTYNYIDAGGVTFNNIVADGDLSIYGINSFQNVSVTSGTLYIGDDQVFNSLSLEEGTEISIGANNTQTINASLSLNGTIDNPVVVNSTSDGVAGIFSAPVSATITANFVHLKDNTATGGASFKAFDSSDFGNVTGWTNLLAGQTIDFASLNDVYQDDGTFVVSASSDSGLDVSFEVASGPATSGGTNGSEITPTGSGLVAIKATQSGNGIFGSAYPEIQYLHIDATHEPNELGDFKQAYVVLGQPDEITDNYGYSDISLPEPWQVAVSKTGKMAVANGSRVLIWNQIPSSPNTPADVVIGHNDFITESEGVVSASTFDNNVYSLAFSHDDKLLIADESRVLIWNSIPTSNGTSADIIIGQPDFSSTIVGTEPNRFESGPKSIATYYNSANDTEKLLISDFNNSRVLIYNSIPTSNDASADNVIGQFDMYSYSTGAAADRFYYPLQIAISNEGKLFVADYGNSRVVVFNSIPDFDGASADMVLGQPDFGQSEFGTSDIKYGYSTGVAISRTGKLAVTDYGNSRVLIYNSVPANNTTPPDYILGQPDDTSNETNYNDNISGRTLSNPIISSWDLSENLFVSDNGNNRVLLYGAADMESPVVESFSLLQPRYTMGATDQKTTFTLSDRSGIASVIGYYNDVNYFDNESPSYEQVELTDIGNSTFEFDLSVIQSLSSKPTGIEYYIEAYDNYGNAISTASNKQVLPVYYPDGIAISGYGVGSNSENYKIMAIPAILDNQAVEHVFQNITGGGYNNTKMRIFSYSGGTATDYSEASGSTNLQVGKGYFALATSGSNSSITSPDGAVTSFVSTDDGSGENIHEFDINLVNGWNLIGNPFQHDIVWNDIKTLSGITAGQVDNLQNYTGNYNNITTIPAGGGAFVSNNTGSNFTLRIPAKINSGGRMEGISENENPISESSWEVWLRTYNYQGGEVALGGVGMEADAILGKDQYDWLNPPAFSRMKQIEFANDESGNYSFKKDIRETSTEMTWDFAYKVEDVSSDKQELHWDNTHLGYTSPNLYLIDKTNFVILDMKKENSYEFNHSGKTEFEIYFGDKALENILPDELITQSPFPNPFSNEVNFRLGLPADENYSVEIRIFDSLGKTVRYLSNNDLAPGYNSMVWDGLNTDGRLLPSGIYAYSIHVKGKKTDSISSGKLIKR